MSELKSCLAPYIESFLTYREALFHSNSAYRPVFMNFDRFCAEHFPGEMALTQEMVLLWMQKRPREHGGGLQARGSLIRRFGIYLDGIGVPSYILPLKYAGGNSSFTPYIFTDTELAALFFKINSMKATSLQPFANLILPVLFRLIYTCGLRPNEGRELKRKNVFLNTGEILLTATKRSKERIVVMSEDMRSLCERYEEKRKIFAQNSEYFFPGSNGCALSNTWIRNQFQKCWAAANPNVSEDELPRVRVYDLRHRFASAALQRWLDNGTDLNAKLPYLRTYMGHSTFSQTAYYIHMLPENLLKSSGIDWASFGGVIPEVDVWPE